MQNKTFGVRVDAESKKWDSVRLWYTPTCVFYNNLTSENYRHRPGIFLKRFMSSKRTHKFLVQTHKIGSSTLNQDNQKKF